MKHKRSPRGIVVVDQDGAPTGLAFEAPNWLNGSVPKGDTWVKSFDNEQSVSKFELPKFENNDI